MTNNQTGGAVPMKDTNLQKALKEAIQTVEGYIKEYSTTSKRDAAMADLQPWRDALAQSAPVANAEQDTKRLDWLMAKTSPDDIEEFDDFESIPFGLSKSQYFQKYRELIDAALAAKEQQHG
jgi:hypothetical protein